MENPTCSSVDETAMAKTKKKSKGGLKTMPSIIANEAFEKVASMGLSPNMIVYLMRDYNMTVIQGTKFLNYWSAANNFTGLFGAFVADSYFGRFLAIGLGSILSFTGMALLWSTTMIPNIKPPSCNESNRNCKFATAGQLSMLIFALSFMSLGGSLIRPCSVPFGGDQLDDTNKHGNNRLLESFFSWYYVSSAIAIVIALTVIVYIQDHYGWRLGFGLPALFMFFSLTLFFLASPFYIKKKPRQSLLTDLVRVLVAAFDKKNVPYPDHLNSTNAYHSKANSGFVAPTNKLRFLNKACIITNPTQELAVDGSALNPWRLCTIKQVEELKALIRVIPLMSTGILMSVNSSQGAFPLLQARSMNRHLTSNFEIPAASFLMFTIITLMIWVVLYDRVIIPLASKIKGKPFRISPKHRMGIGILISSITMIVSAIIEGIRRRKAISRGFINNPRAVLDMSAMWLVPQHCVSGVAEAFYAIGQIEFYYSEFPIMASIVSSLAGMAMAVGNLLATFMLSSVDDITSKGGKESWISNNINKGHYDYYYWLLAVLSFINFLYFLVCSWCYGTSEQTTLFRDEENKPDQEAAEDLNVNRRTAGLDETDNSGRV